MISLDDTIAAIATASGAAGLGVVRVSGPEALRAADAVFRGATRLADASSHTLHHGWAVSPQGPAAGPVARESPAGGGGAGGASPAAGDAGRIGATGRRLDEVVAAVFRAPRSYTREDVVEFSCHGGEQCTRGVLGALLSVGARLAGPGEFTLRAFLNGRCDLVQAEAVADLIQAGSERARELALAQLAGDLSARVRAIAERVADAAAEVEARVDFAEDVGGVEVPEHVVSAIESAARDLQELLAGAAYGRAVREGVRIPIVGRPNVGKSSLFNALVGEARAIVTPVPGTTRDRVSETIEVAGIRVTLSDTAGLRDTVDPVEAIGVSRTREAMETGAAVLWVVDGSNPLEPDDRRIAARLAGRRVVVALNKCDRRDGQAAVPVDEVASLLGGSRGAPVRVSALRGLGLEGLRQELVATLCEEGAALVAVVTNPRHVDALERARGALGAAAEEGRRGAPGEIVASDLRECLSAIGEVTGRTVGEDLLDRIFARFCVGK